MLLKAIPIMSLIFGVGGIIFAFIQYRSRIKAETMIKSNLAVTLNRIKMLVPRRDSLEVLVADVNKPEVVRWVWVKYKGLSDLYVMIVNHCLSFERKFTYDNLKKLVDTGVISTAWEECVWRNLIVQRPENITIDVPENFVS